MISGNTIPDLTATDTVREDTASPASSGYKVVSPLPGIIISVRVKTGDKVRSGQELVVLEAMKKDFIDNELPQILRKMTLLGIRLEDLQINEK